ncbi:formin-like protein 6 [Diospyros lotus]|uniref:formin-like protein 6 n=1 Tax=Diospyros lotus TaxID=55363 RepID=UPI0022513715|nr:formin-like protein 6 [Diospyros lotus]
MSPTTALARPPVSPVLSDHPATIGRPPLSWLVSPCAHAACSLKLPRPTLLLLQPPLVSSITAGHRGHHRPPPPEPPLPSATPLAPAPRPWLRPSAVAASDCCNG